MLNVAKGSSSSFQICIIFKTQTLLDNVDEKRLKLRKLVVSYSQRYRVPLADFQVITYYAATSDLPAGVQCLDSHLCCAAVHRKHTAVRPPPSVSGRLDEAKCQSTSQAQKVSGQRFWLNRYACMYWQTIDKVSGWNVAFVCRAVCLLHSSVAATQVRHCSIVKTRKSSARLQSCQKAMSGMLCHCTI